MSIGASRLGVTAHDDRAVRLRGYRTTTSKDAGVDAIGAVA